MLNFIRGYLMAMHRTLVLLFVSLFVTSVFAEVLLETSSTWEGGEIVYPKGDPEITSVILRLGEGDMTDFHCHPVPTLGYILSGSIEVETKTGKKSKFNEGESVVELMGTLHRSKAIDGPVEVVVFYVGETLTPNTVLAIHDPDFIYCDR